MKPFYTADDVELKVGMTVFVVDNDTQLCLLHIVGSIADDGRKIIYADESGSGARVDGVFTNPVTALEAHEAKFVHLRLDTTDTGEILLALARTLKSLRAEVEIIRLAQDRELTQWERAMLSQSLMHAPHEEIRDNLMHYICAAESVEGIIKTISAEYDRAKGKE